MPRPKISPATCTEALGSESDHSHGSAAVLEFLYVVNDISLPEPVLPRMLEQMKSSSEEEPPRPRLQLPPPMPWRGMHLVQEKQGRRLVLKEVATKKPFALHASRADGRFRLSRLLPFDGFDEASVCSNGEKDFEGDESGGKCKTTVE
jgi:hypothetical protein